MIKGNRLYLICTVCGGDTQHAQMLGQRRENGYSRAPDRRMLDAWFDEHAECGGTLDHFKLALAQEANWDAETPISPDHHIGAAVRMALVKS